MLKRIVAVVLVFVASGCGSAAPGAPSAAPAPGAPSATPASGGPSVDKAALADSVRRSYTRADVDFMQGMIHHHAQALVMAAWAPDHGASPALRTMCERIINAQRDEIVLMQNWLRSRAETVPDERTMMSGGHDPGMHMPGMLSTEQMEALDAARGEEFDRLFLTYMIQHHEGALTMVDELFATPGAGREQAIFKLASDIGADQSSEIVRMQTMLHDLLFGGGGSR